MPKYCCVPNCRTESGSEAGTRKSFYKFPLHDPDRLQLWLRNMGRQNWTPSRHQYICHQHFGPSSFKVRWGIRYLENDAVPTLFQEGEKRNASEHGERKAKRFRADGSQSVTVSHDRAAALHLYEVTVAPSEQGPTCLLGPSDAAEWDDCVQGSGDGRRQEAELPLTLFQTVEDFSDGEEYQVVLMSEGQEQLVDGITAAILTQVHGPVGDAAEASLGAEGLADAHADERPRVIAYFETIPNVFPCEAQVVFSPETVVSSSLSSEPITSTLPIVSKHVPPAPTSLKMKVKRLDADEEEEVEHEEDEEVEEEDGGFECLGRQLEEHCYHRSSVSRHQLEAIVLELQKKVKVLQQRHRRHLEKLLGLENTVNQLRQSNLLNQERLQLLQRVDAQTSPAVPDVAQTVDVYSEEEDAAYLCTSSSGPEER